MTQAFPGTAPARRAYPPPVTVGFVDAGGATNVEHGLRTQQSVRDNYYQPWRAAHPKGIDPNLLRDNAGAFSVSDAALALQPALDAVKADADAAKDKVDALINGQRVGDDVASQIKAQRDWARTKDVLASIKDIPKLVAEAKDAIDNADDAQIPILVEELASYLRSRNAPTGWLPQAYSGRIPGLSEAQADAILLARQYAVLAQNHEGLTRAMERDTDAPPLLDPFKVTAEPYDGGAYSPGGNGSE